VAGGDGDDDGAVGVGGAARVGIVGEAILGAEFAVDAVEDGGEVLGGVGKEHGAAGGVGHGFEGVFAGGVAAAFIFDGANDDGVDEGVGADGGLAGGFEVVAAGGFAGVGDEDDDAAAFVAALLERARAQDHGVIDGGAGAIGNFPHGPLQKGHVIGEAGALVDVFIEGEDGQAVAGAQDLTDEMGGGFLLEADLFVGAETGVDHQCKIERLRSFGLEDFDFLLNAFLKELKNFLGKIGSGAIFIVEDADEDIDEIDVDLNAATLFGRVLRIVRGGRWGGLDNLAGLAYGRRGGSRSVRRSGSSVRGRTGFLRPGRAVGLVLGGDHSNEQENENGQERSGARAEGCHRHWILGCGFRMGCRHGCGREFAIGPDGAVFEVFFFPDGDGALESVNGEAASVEGGGAVGRADGDEDAGLADFEAAEAMDDDDAVNFIFFVELGGDLAHFCEGHGFVGFVVEIESGAIVGLIADKAVEGYDGAVIGGADMADEGGHVDGLAREVADVVVEGRGHGASAAAHGRKEGDFVAGVERSVPGGEFLVTGGDERGAEFCELGMAGGEKGEELFDGGGVGGSDGFFGVAEDFFQAAEEEDFDANGLGDGWHGGIVTRMRGWS